MPIETINIGNIANDGTGDDLREAFRKVNDNFELLDLREPESTTAVNLGDVGEGIFANKNDDELQFKKIAAGSNITLTANGNYITVDAANSISQIIFSSDSGSVVLDSSGTLNINGQNNITTNAAGNSIQINVDPVGLVATDPSPTLGGNLNANSQDITGASTISASTFSGNLEGLVYGIDVRNLQTQVTGFDFGLIYPVYENAVDFILAQSDVDFGTFVGAGVETAIVDLGSIV